MVLQELGAARQALDRGVALGDRLVTQSDLRILLPHEIRHETLEGFGVFRRGLGGLVHGDHYTIIDIAPPWPHFLH